MGITFYMIYKLVYDFLQFNSFNVSSTKWKEHVILPAISICGTNFINYTLLSTELSEIHTETGDLLQDFDDLLTDVKKFSTYGNILNELNLTKYSDLLEWEGENGSIALRFKTGIYDMLVGEFDYLFRGSGFIIENPAKVVNPSALGMCFELNDGGLMKQDISGANGGIVIDLDAKVKDYLFTTSTKGFVVFIRDQDETVMLNKGGYLVSPGTEAFLKLSARSVTRLGKPHGTCKNNLSKYSKYGKRFESVRECKQRQTIEAMVEHCGCIPWYFANRMLSLKKYNVLDDAVRLTQEEEGSGHQDSKHHRDEDHEEEAESGVEHKHAGIHLNTEGRDGHDGGDAEHDDEDDDDGHIEDDDLTNEDAEHTEEDDSHKKRSINSSRQRRELPKKLERAFKKARRRDDHLYDESVRSKRDSSHEGPTDAPESATEFATEWWPTAAPIYNTNYSDYVCTFTIQAVCDSVIEDEIKEGTLKMEGCPEPCQYNEWDVELATTVFPSTEKYFEKFIQFEVYVDPAPDFQYARDNMARIHIFYDDIKMDVLEQEKAYEAQNFIAEFGGTVDLFIGFSFFTIFQLIEIGIAACIYKCLGRRRHSPSCSKKDDTLPSLDERDIAPANEVDTARANGYGKAGGGDETIEINIIGISLDDRDRTDKKDNDYVNVEISNPNRTAYE